MGRPDARGPLKSKLAKWATFVVGLLVATVAGDTFAAMVNQEPVSTARLFGRGELLVASIGLLIAASADLLFDRMVRGSGRILHGVLLAVLFLVTLSIAVGYGATRVELANQTAAQAAERGAFRAELSFYVLLASVLLSGWGVYLSEEVKRHGS